MSDGIVGAYSHRNGETTPPTKTGWFWFRGEVDGQPYADSLTMMAVAWSDELRAIGQENVPIDPKYWVGAWYGPIVPPWEATPSPVGASVPVDDDFSALDMLKWMVEAYHPQWHYTMEKTGYECSYCKCMFKTSKEFNDTSAHNVGCQWAQSKEWLQQQRGQG